VKGSGIARRGLALHARQTGRFEAAGKGMNPTAWARCSPGSPATLRAPGRSRGASGDGSSRTLTHRGGRHPTSKTSTVELNTQQRLRIAELPEDYRVVGVDGKAQLVRKATGQVLRIHHNGRLTAATIGAKSGLAARRADRAAPGADLLPAPGAACLPSGLGRCTSRSRVLASRAQRSQACGHRLRLALRLRVRSKFRGHTLAAMWLWSAERLDGVQWSRSQEVPHARPYDAQAGGQLARCA